MNQFKELEQVLANAYEQNTTLDEAERLAARFLVAALQVSRVLRDVDLDSRVRKTGVKALRAALYLNAIEGKDKKPTEGQLTALIESDQMVEAEQKAFDQAEVDREELKRMYETFQAAHIHFRNLAKGAFGA